VARAAQNSHGRSTFAMISAKGVTGHDWGRGWPVLLARQFIGAATTALSLITGAFLPAVAAGNAQAQGAAMKEAITSLEEQAKVGVTSVENGRNFQNSRRGEATMPDGPAIFETSGAWEDPRRRATCGC
jgi:hypothetical protein